MTGYESKRAAAQDKLNDDDLTIAYQSGYYDGKKAAQPAQEPVAMLFGSLPVYDTTPPQPAQELDFGPQPDMHHGMNQDDWKDIVAAISKARDSRGIYLACRPADVFQDWFLAMGLFKPKEKNNG